MERVDVLVLAPHPDDEVLMAAGVLARAKAEGKRVAVAVVTNGDLSCERDGIRRESETVTALSQLGVDEDEVFFLGYPDGSVDKLGPLPLAPLERRDLEGHCVMGNTTYAARGVGATDVHSLFNGAPGVYTSETLTGDITQLLEALEPQDVYVSHPIDEHPDHAFVYTYLRRALERANIAPPTVHRSLVHIGGCYPTAPGMPPCPDVRFAPHEHIPPMPPLYEAYRPAEKAPVPEAMLDREPSQNPKYKAIASYPSQTGPLRPFLSYLFAFARTEENFFPESLVADEDGALRRAAPAAPETAHAGTFMPLGPWLDHGDHDERSVEQRAPFACRVGDATDGTTLDVLVSSAGYYEARIEKDSLVLVRVGPHAETRELRRWPVPGAALAGAHAFALSVDDRPDDGGIAELSVRYDGELLGVAVDARPILRGGALMFDGVSAEQVDCRAL